MIVHCDTWSGEWKETLSSPNWKPLVPVSESIPATEKHDEKELSLQERKGSESVEQCQIALVKTFNNRRNNSSNPQCAWTPHGSPTPSMVTARCRTQRYYLNTQKGKWQVLLPQENIRFTGWCIRFVGVRRLRFQSRFQNRYTHSYNPAVGFLTTSQDNINVDYATMDIMSLWKA